MDNLELVFISHLKILSSSSKLFLKMLLRDVLATCRSSYRTSGIHFIRRPISSEFRFNYGFRWEYSYPIYLHYIANLVRSFSQISTVQ